MAAQKTIRLRMVISFMAIAMWAIAAPSYAFPVRLPTCSNGDDAASPASEAITLRAVGDIVIGSDWPTSVYPEGFERQAETWLKQALGSADVVFGNFEGTLTTHNVSTKKPNSTTTFAFRMPPSFARLLKNAGFNIFHIANNHTNDFGAVGFADTIANLAKANILTVGEPDKFTLQKVGNMTIAWVGVSHLYRHNNIGDTQKFDELMRMARPLADLVIVSMQAGAEGSEALNVKNEEEMFLGENRGNTYAFAHRAIDLGADLVLGHGPHVVRGMECYKGKLIAYSLGNFVGYNALSIKRAAAVTMVLEVRLSKNGKTVWFDVVPMKFNESRFAERDDSQMVRYLVNSLSHKPPLNGSVSLPVPRDGDEKYRRWLSTSDLVKIVTE